MATLCVLPASLSVLYCPRSLEEISELSSYKEEKKEMINVMSMSRVTSMLPPQYVVRGEYDLYRVFFVDGGSDCVYARNADYEGESISEKKKKLIGDSSLLFGKRVRKVKYISSDYGTASDR